LRTLILSNYSPPSMPTLGPILGSSVTCMAAFFLGTCLSLILTELPQGIPLIFLCVVTVILCVLGVRWRAPACFIAGFIWICFSAQSFLDSSFPSEYERIDFIASGEVVDLPSSRQGNVRFRFKVNSVVNRNLSVLVGQHLQISCYRCLYKIRAGERWRLTLRAKRPHGYASWGAFDYEKYLFRHRIVAKGYVRPKGENQRLGVSAFSIHQWRQSLLEEIQSIVGNGSAGNIISALALGVKSGFDNQQQMVFQSTGVNHLMAISGLHVGLVFFGASFLLRYFLSPAASVFEYWPRQKLVLLPALVVACLYAALAGFSVSTQRALIMLIVFVLSKFLVRNAHLTRVLLIAIVVLILIDPFAILDVGFWLSCSAVAIIALSASYAQVGGIDSNASVSLNLPRLQGALWLGMLPLGVIFFGKISLVSPLVNLLAVPLFCTVLIPATLLSVFILSVGFEFLGSWCLRSLSYGFEYVFQALEFISRLEYSKIHVTPIVWWQWLLFLIVVMSFLFSFRIRFLVAGLFIAALLISCATSLEDDELQVSLLDVGQGLSLVIQTKNSVTVYDTGPRYGTGFTAAEAVLLPFLRQRGIHRIDTLVISHADNDHIGGLETLQEAFQIDHIITSRIDKVTEAQECVAGQTWVYDRTQFSVISPQADTPVGSNNRSCVIMLEHLGTKVLLSGDIEKQVERFLVRNYSGLLSADILLVPHQGSKTSSTEQFLKAVSPNLAMLAAGYQNHYGHPHESVIQRYQANNIEVLSTIDHGSILLKINSHGWAKILYRQQYRRFWHHQKLPNNRV